MTDGSLEALRSRVAQTTIDPTSFLSTDYFNSFNDVIMILGMIGGCQEGVKLLNV